MTDADFYDLLYRNDGQFLGLNISDFSLSATADHTLIDDDHGGVGFHGGMYLNHSSLIVLRSHGNNIFMIKVLRGDHCGPESGHVSYAIKGTNLSIQHTGVI